MFKKYYKKTNNKKSSKNNKLSGQFADEISKEKLSQLHPMLIGLLTYHASKNPNSGYLNDSYKIVIDTPYKLTTKWINSLNRWTEDMITAMSIDPPDLEVGKRHSFESLIVSKVKNAQDVYGGYAITCIDERGWKFYFRKRINLKCLLEEY